jgi:glycosyltransferase involved in cell wall biosynthesis
MRIAHIIPQHLVQMGGLQIFVHNIAKQQVKNGHEVFVLTHSYPGKSSDYPYKIIKIKQLKGISYLFYFYKLVAEIYLFLLQKKYKFDIWQVNGGYPYGAMLVDFFQKNNIPSVLRCSGDDIQISYEYDYGVRRNPSINKLVEKNYYKFNKAVAITNTVANEYKKINIPLQKIEVIPNGVDFDRISKNKPKFDIREKHGIPDNSKIILTVGRHHPKKNYSIIPEIIKYLIENNCDVYWIVIGSNSNTTFGQGVDKYIMDRIILIDELKDGGGLSVEVPSNELIGYYKQSDIFALTSALETFGIVIIEAMAAGLPIVCFDAPGVSYVMSEDCGYICELNNIDEFKVKLIKLIKDDNSYFSRKSIERAQNYKWDAVSKKYLSMYKKIIKKNEN